MRKELEDMTIRYNKMARVKRAAADEIKCQVTSGGCAPKNMELAIAMAVRCCMCLFCMFVCCIAHDTCCSAVVTITFLLSSFSFPSSHSFIFVLLYDMFADPNSLSMQEDADEIELVSGVFVELTTSMKAQEDTEKGIAKGIE